MLEGVGSTQLCPSVLQETGEISDRAYAHVTESTLWKH